MRQITLISGLKHNMSNKFTEMNLQMVKFSKVLILQYLEIETFQLYSNQGYIQILSFVFNIVNSEGQLRKEPSQVTSSYENICKR